MPKNPSQVKIAVLRSLRIENSGGRFRHRKNKDRIFRSKKKKIKKQKSTKNENVKATKVSTKKIFARNINIIVTNFHFI